MVERFRRQLKAAFIARLTSSDWLQELPWVLLGPRATPKEDLGCSTAELVYGSVFRLPAEFVQESASKIASERLRQLRVALETLMPVPPRWQQKVSREHGAAVPDLPRGARYIFVRIDAVKPALSRQYEEPFRVLEAGPKTFKLLLRGKEDYVSMDWLKPAYVDRESEVASQSSAARYVHNPSDPETPPTDESGTSTNHLSCKTRAGRASKAPMHFQDYDMSTVISNRV